MKKFLMIIILILLFSFLPAFAATETRAARYEEEPTNAVLLEKINNINSSLSEIKGLLHEKELRDTRQDEKINKTAIDVTRIDTTLCNLIDWLVKLAIGIPAGGVITLGGIKLKNRKNGNRANSKNG